MYEGTYTYVVIFSVLLLGPVIYDHWKQHQWAKEKKEPATPTPGLYRLLIVYGIIFLLAIIVFQLIANITSNIRSLSNAKSDLKTFLNSTKNQVNISTLTLIK